jgi:hypothetical protein
VVRPKGPKGGAWNTETSLGSSLRSSWGAALIMANGTCHGWFNGLPGERRLSPWPPGAKIAHGVPDPPLRPPKAAAHALASRRNVLPQFWAY